MAIVTKPRVKLISNGFDAREIQVLLPDGTNIAPGASEISWEWKANSVPKLTLVYMLAAADVEAEAKPE